jgi:hypothetical protein
MTRTHETEDRRLRRKTAAFRLKHDVGKALRWSAPEARETDAQALRARLAADLLPGASGGGAGRSVLKIFFEWKREEGAMFDSSDPDLKALEEAMAVVARLAPRLSSLEEISFSSLASLDSACVEASRACTAFYRRVAVDEGPEIVRPFGRRGDGA